MDLEIISRLLITIGILSQLIHLLYVNKKLFAPSFFIYALGSYIMTYSYYISDRMYSSRVLFKILNSTLLLLISFFSR
jgi:hypothetical protein